MLFKTGFSNVADYGIKCCKHMISKIFDWGKEVTDRFFLLFDGGLKRIMSASFLKKSSRQFAGKSVRR